MEEQHTEPGHSKTLWFHLKRGFAEAHRRRPVSFYLLLVIPLVMMLGAPMANYREHPNRFAAAVFVMLLFFLVVSVKAVREFFAIFRRHMTERRMAYKETIGDESFMTELGKRVRENLPPEITPPGTSTPPQSE